MKKVLLIIFLYVSVNAFSQTNTVRVDSIFLKNPLSDMIIYSGPRDLKLWGRNLESIQMEGGVIKISTTLDEFIKVDDNTESITISTKGGNGNFFILIDQETCVGQPKGSVAWINDVLTRCK